jgi:hypothetical protein
VTIKATVRDIQVARRIYRRRTIINWLVIAGALLWAGVLIWMLWSLN